MQPTNMGTANPGTVPAHTTLARGRKLPATKKTILFSTAPMSVSISPRDLANVVGQIPVSLFNDPAGLTSYIGGSLFGAAWFQLPH